MQDLVQQKRLRPLDQQADREEIANTDTKLRIQKCTTKVEFQEVATELHRNTTIQKTQRSIAYSKSISVNTD